MRIHLPVRRLICAAVALGAIGLASPALAARTRGGLDRRLSNSTSTNWSGYAVTGGSYSSVSSSWTVPSLNCAQTPSTYSSFWVGLDGDTTNTVEQTGIEADCSGSTPVYYGWYEMYPKFPANFGGVVAPGDVIHASVASTAGGSFTLTLSDGTKWSVTTTQTSKKARRGSAEVITEAPYSGGVLPLADFGTVNYSGATVNGGLLKASTPGIDPITMVNGKTGAVESATSSISNGAFSNIWTSE